MMKREDRVNVAGLAAWAGRAGFVVPAAIVAIAIVTVLALTGLYVAQNEAQSNRGIGDSWKALYAADAGARKTLIGWRQTGANSLSPGDSLASSWRTLDDGSVFRTVILRIDEGTSDTSLFRLRTVGRPTAQSTAQRNVFAIVRSSRISELCCEAAVKSQGSIKLSGSAVDVSGMDDPPTSWDERCSGASTSDLPGITIDDSDNVTTNGQPNIDGDPPIQEDTTISDSDFTDFGEASYADLAAGADKKFTGDQSFSSLAPVVENGQCDISVDTNWGDPIDSAGECFDYLPVVHVAGNLRLEGDALGQGILLVDGNLEMHGDADFYGVIIVQGEANISGTPTIYGSLMVRNGVSADEDTEIKGNTLVQYSSCVMAEATNNVRVTTDLPGRHWFEVTE